MVGKIIAVLMALTILAFPVMALTTSAIRVPELQSVMVQSNSVFLAAAAPNPIQLTPMVEIVEESISVPVVVVVIVETPIIEPCNDYILCWNDEPILAVLSEPMKVTNTIPMLLVR